MLMIALYLSALALLTPAGRSPEPARGGGGEDKAVEDEELGLTNQVASTTTRPPCKAAGAVFNPGVAIDGDSAALAPI